MLLSVFHDEVWLPSCANLRECTMVGYESAWRCHIVDAFGGLEIDSITAGMIETWMAGMPRGAARKAWGVLRTMLRKAFRWGMSSVDVTTRVRGPKRTDHQPRVLDSRQIATLLRGFWGHELEAWLICSVTLGLRPEEALGLEWSDIDLRGGQVRIRRGVQWVSGHEVVVEPKTDLSARELVLPRFAVLRLRLLAGEIAFRNPAMEAAVYEQQTHSVSGRTRRHGQRQRQVHRQWTAELRDGG